MKKVKVSLAALTLIVAIAGTTTANTTKTHKNVPLCSIVDPGGTECLNQTDIECCEDDFTGEIITAKVPIENL
ncbi:hypothetical protein FAM09_10525 [Niastella caeni]|uniref:Secreted protein n=1 Tax=Niastella caeni TaxID=2569763 RepID=A0A4S8HX55_9BACT|nr:hypothetical protein [Niastella caeni]THU40293.1 hypothetical protein FAM09_10525 [Niastella caeni]